MAKQLKSRAQIAKDSRARHRESYNAYMREWRRKNPEREKQIAAESYARTGAKQDRVEARRRYHLKVAYDISLEEYEEMFAKQKGRCAACGQVEPSCRNMPVDHDHRTGKVRSLLCSECNPALGLLRENPERIRALLKYVRKHNG